MRVAMYFYPGYFDIQLVNPLVCTPSTSETRATAASTRSNSVSRPCCIPHSVFFTHRTRGLPKGQTPSAYPAAEGSIFLSGFSFRVYKLPKSPGPMEQLIIFLLGSSFRMHTMWWSAHGCGKMTYEHSRLGKKVKNGKRRTRMKSAEGSFFRLIFPQIWRGI